MTRLKHLKNSPFKDQNENGPIKSQNQDSGNEYGHNQESSEERKQENLVDIMTLPGQSCRVVKKAVTSFESHSMK